MLIFVLAVELMNHLDTATAVDGAALAEAAEQEPLSPVVENDTEGDVEKEELASSDAHHTHLVEGDFFPAEAEAEAVVATMDAEAESEAETISTQMDAETEEIGNAVAEDNGGVVVALSPPMPATPKKQKRVLWADDQQGVRVGCNLVKHVTTFYMPHSTRISRYDDKGPSSPTRPVHSNAVNPAPASLFREKKNTDGSTYKFCKAQRPAQYFIEWKRQLHEYGRTPFDPQPTDSNEAAHTAKPITTLFGTLYQRRVVTRGADGHARVRSASRQKSGAGDPRLPFIRAGLPHNAPLGIPLKRPPG